MPNLTSSAISTNAFISGIGVCTHIPYTDGDYANIGNVISELQYLGVTEVRDGITDGQNGSAPLSSYIALAKAGIHFTFVTHVGTSAELDAQLNLIRQVQAAVPGSVHAIEGPNEVNNWPITFDGVSGFDGALKLQATLYSKVHADPALSGVKVAYFTGYAAGGLPVGPDPVASGLADYNTQHPYPKWGLAPAQWVDRANALPNTTSPTTPAIYTETGYSTNEVGQAVQAKYTLSLLFDTAKQGVAKTYLYELMDGYAPGSPQGNHGWGLFDHNDAPKQSATAIHNLTTILRDTGGMTYSTPSLDYSISGLPATGNSMVLAKANGAYDLVIWAEPKLYDNQTGAFLTAPTTTATINLSQAVGGYAVYDPMLGATAITTGGPTSQISVAVTDHPVIVELRGAAAATPPPTPPPAPTPTPEAPAGGVNGGLTGSDGDDVLAGLDGQANYIRGYGGADSITGGIGRNDVNGNQGADTIIGRSQVGDWLLGGQGDDVIEVRASARNIINGNMGFDTLTGGGGAETLRGGQADDVINAGGGDDWLSGDRGVDYLTGGDGADVFHSGGGLGVSHVMDFNFAQGDRIQLDPGSHASFSQAGANVLVDLGGGAQLILHDRSLAALQSQPGWVI